MMMVLVDGIVHSTVTVASGLNANDAKHSNQDATLTVMV